MSSALTPVIKFAFRRDWKPLDEALVLGPAYQAPQFDNPLEALNSISKTGGLIICCLTDKSDLLQIATLLKMSRRISRDAVFKIAVVNFSNNKLIETAINKLGVQDVIEPNVSPKSLRFKIELWMKAIKSQTKTVDNGGLSIRNSENAKSALDKKADEKNYVILPAMDCVDDMWLIHKDFECKKILGRWLIRVLGPSPYVGLWAEVPNKSGVWKFEFRDGHAADYIAGSGSWFYRGEQKPDFNWKENIWYMAGESLDLFYYDSEVLSRLQLKDKVLSICANSHSARSKETAIYESFDKDLVFKKDVARLGKMEGTGKTEVLNQDQLSRLEREIQQSREASMSSGSLKGRITPEEKAMAEAKAPQSQKEKANTNAAGEKASDEKEKPVSHLSNLQGKAKTDASSEKNLSGKIKAEEISAKGSKERPAADYSSTETQERKSKQNLPKPIDASKAGRDPYQQDALSDMIGKAATDHIKQSNLSKKDSHDSRASGPESAEQRTNNKADVLNDIHGKNKTDHLGGKNLSGKNKQSGDIGGDPLTLNLNQAISKEASPRGNGQKNAENPGGDLSGKGKTDHLNPKNLSGKQKGEGDIVSDPLALQLKPEDKKPDHLGGKSSTDKLNNNGLDGPAGGDIAEGSLLDYENKKHTHETKLKGRMLAEQFAAAEARKNQYKDNDGADLDGNSSTDQIKKHYSSTREQAEAKEKERLQKKAASRGKTGKAADKFAGQYQSPTGKVQNISQSGVIESADQALSFEEGFEHDGKVLPFQVEALKLKVKAEEAKRVEELARDLTDESDAELTRASQTATVTTFLIHQNQTRPCQIDDYFEENVIFRMPGTEIKLQDKVVLDMSFDYLGKKSQLKLEGTVSSNEINEETSYVTVALRANEVDEFESFMKLYKSRQQNVDVFFKRVKGY